MAHIAIQEQLDGKTVDWREQESSQQDRTSGGGLPRRLQKREPLDTPSEGLRVTRTSDRLRQMSNAERSRT
jgi:hypothetical protein